MRIIKSFLGILFFLLLISSSVFEINDADTMHYLANGKYILENGFYRDCIFNYTTNQCEKAYYSEWLFHLMTYIVYFVGKYQGLVIFQALIVLSIFSVIYLHNKQLKYSYFSSFILMFIALLISMERFMVRADLFAILLAVLFYYFLNIFLNKKDHSKNNFIQLFLILLPLQILWANIHGSFPLSYLIIFSFLLHEIAINFWNRFFLNSDIVVFSQQVKILSLLLASSVLVSMINPYGISAFLLPFQVFFFNKELFFQVEHIGVFESDDFIHLSNKLFKIISLISLVFILKFKKIKLRDVFILVAFFYLSVQSVRNIALFAVFSALILPKYLDNLLIPLNRFLSNKMNSGKLFSYVKPIFALGMIAINILLIISFVTNDFYLKDYRTRRFGLGVSEIKFPAGAVNFVFKNNIQGNLFNNYDIGGYLNWSLFPQRKSFIDGHTYTKDSYTYYSKIMQGEIAYNDAAEKYKINYFLLGYDSRDTAVLIRKLYEDKNWSLIYFDENSVIFLANKPENNSHIEKYKIDFENNKNYKPNKVIALTGKNNFSLGHTARGTILINLNFLEKAEYELEKAIKLDSKNYIAHYLLGNVYQELNKDEQALNSYKSSIKYQPNIASFHFSLGSLYFKKGLSDEAIKEYKKTLQINYRKDLANYALGLIYETRGDLINAKKYYERELTINPLFQPAQRKLKSI